MQRRIARFERFLKLNEAEDSSNTISRLSKYLKDKLWGDSAKLMYGSDYTGDPASDSRIVKVRDEDVTMGEIFKDAWNETEQFCDNAASSMIGGSRSRSTDSLSYLIDKLSDKQSTVAAVKKSLEANADFEQDWGLDANLEGLKQMPGIPFNKALPNGPGEIGYYFTYKMAEYAYDWFVANVGKAIGATTKVVNETTAPTKSGEKSVNYKMLGEFFTKKVGIGEIKDGRLVKKTSDLPGVQDIISNFYSHIHKWKIGEYGDDVNKLLGHLKNSIGGIWNDAYWGILENIINNKDVNFATKSASRGAGPSRGSSSTRDTSDIKIDDGVVAGYGL